jgi:hypothetical protein
MGRNRPDVMPVDSQYLFGLPTKRPLDLKFNLLFGQSSFMFDTDNGSRWNGDFFSSYLYLKTIALFNAVGQPTQLTNRSFD